MDRVAPTCSSLSRTHAHYSNISWSGQSVNFPRHAQPDTVHRSATKREYSTLKVGYPSLRTSATKYFKLCNTNDTYNTITQFKLYNINYTYKTITQANKINVLYVCFSVNKIT